MFFQRKTANFDLLRKGFCPKYLQCGVIRCKLVCNGSAIYNKSIEGYKRENIIYFKKLFTPYFYQFFCVFINKGKTTVFVHPELNRVCACLAKLKIKLVRPVNWGCL